MLLLLDAIVGKVYQVQMVETVLPADVIDLVASCMQLTQRTQSLQHY